jgi:hypothetical protein
MASFRDLAQGLVKGIDSGTGRYALLLDQTRVGQRHLQPGRDVQVGDRDAPAIGRARIKLADMRAGRMTDDDWTRMARRMSEITKAPSPVVEYPALAGVPHPASACEQTLERTLARCEWAAGRTIAAPSNTLRTADATTDCSSTALRS